MTALRMSSGLFSTVPSPFLLVGLLTVPGVLDGLRFASVEVAVARPKEARAQEGSARRPSKRRPPRRSRGTKKEVAKPVAPEESEVLLERDRSFVVGAPLLAHATVSGVYLWIEDGWLKLAVVRAEGDAQAVATTAVRARIVLESTKAFDEVELGDFQADRRSRSSTAISISAPFGSEPALARLKTTGDVVVRILPGADHARPSLFLGPLGEEVTGAVRIGRL